jgi:hypothetical protein
MAGAEDTLKSRIIHLDHMLRTSLHVAGNRKFAFLKDDVSNPPKRLWKADQNPTGSNGRKFRKTVLNFYKWTGGLW